MTVLGFSKYEGAGNDFVVARVADEARVSSAQASALCDRHFGVGADGVLLVLPPRAASADARMKVINADGSIPEMCGNGLRCAALFVARERGLREGQLIFDTDAGQRVCTIDDRDGKGLVTIDMGTVRVTGTTTIDLDGDPWELVIADAGNPHAITQRTVDSTTMAAIGPRIATHERFPHGTNVEFTTIGEGGIDLVVYERGVGLTLACGTGACAAVAVAVHLGLAAFDSEVEVRLPGGTLAVTVGRDLRAVLRGPARHVFTGELSLPLPSPAQRVGGSQRRSPEVSSTP